MAFQVTLHQMIVFFLVLAVGFVAGKTRIIEKDYLPKFAKLITTIFLPVMIFAYTRIWKRCGSCAERLSYETGATVDSAGTRRRMVISLLQSYRRR